MEQARQDTALTPAPGCLDFCTSDLYKTLENPNALGVYFKDQHAAERLWRGPTYAAEFADGNRIHLYPNKQATMPQYWTERITLQGSGQGMIKEAALLIALCSANLTDYNGISIKLLGPQGNRRLNPGSISSAGVSYQLLKQQHTYILVIQPSRALSESKCATM